jgi:hypothetical protein
MKVTFSLVLVLYAMTISAQTQRALLIGINTYEPPAGVKVSESRKYWTNLNGPVNDVHAITNLIRTRYSFQPANITTLLNKQATRKAILDAMNDLLNKSRPGDIAFIYYAGHGSFVFNSKSKEEGQVDESLVPSDSWKPGVEDIRDKTLASVFNKFIDKKVILTCIFDCCHSGSIHRGINTVQPRARYMPSPDYDVKDPSNPPEPESRPNSNFLALSACQDREKAMEFDDPAGSYGIFTKSLFQAINQQSPDAPVYTIFSAASTLVGSRIIQSPVIAGDQTRMQGTLFGLTKGKLPNKNFVSVIVDSADNILVQGGTLMGIYEGNELTSSDGKVDLKIVGVLGPMSSKAELLKGKLVDVKTRGLFKLTNWVAPTVAQLNIHVPTSRYSLDDIRGFSNVVTQLGKSVISVENGDADISIFQHKGEWGYNTPDGFEKLPEFSATAIQDKFPGKSYRINIPPPGNLVDVINQRFSQMRNVKIVDDASQADYLLYGDTSANGISYALARTQATVQDSLGTMPLKTKEFRLQGTEAADYENIADSLYEYSIRLSKIRTWLTLQPPKLDSFPVHLELRNTAGKRVDTVKSGVRIGQTLSMHLVLDKDFEKKYNNSKKFIYVFMIDRDGKMRLLWPRTTQSSTFNEFPKTDDDGNFIQSDSLRSVKIGTPSGIDNYFLLITNKRIDNPLAMNQEGVRSINSGNGLDGILNIGNEVTRTTRSMITPDKWTVQRMQLLTTH